MKHKKTIRIVIISILIPTVIFMTLAYVTFQAVMHMGSEQIQTKVKNYDTLTSTSPKHATVFFGDSITELYPLEDFYSDYVIETKTPVLNRGISSEKTAGMLARLEKEIIPLHAKHLIMLMGINDIFDGIKPEEIANHIEEMIVIMKEKSPETQLILQAIYPINEQDRDSFYEKLMMKGNGNESVQKTNKLLEALAKKHDITFININSLLSDENGNLKHAYAYDGLHPNASGYRIISDEIKKLIK